jgi:hypothetical protein
MDRIVLRSDVDRNFLSTTEIEMTTKDTAQMRKKPKQVNGMFVRLTDAERARIDRIAKKLGETRTAVLRQAVRRFVELREKDEVGRGGL